MIRHLFISTCFLALLTACSSNSVEDLKWLEGTWSRTYNVTTQQEVWKSSADSLYGKSIFITLEDTTVMENMTIKIKNGILTYTADVEENPKPVDFILSTSRKGFAEFTNPNYDFPQVIRYEITGDSLTTTITGKSGTMPKSATFKYGKVN